MKKGKIIKISVLVVVIILLLVLFHLIGSNMIEMIKSHLEI